MVEYCRAKTAAATPNACGQEIQEKEKCLLAACEACHAPVPTGEVVWLRLQRQENCSKKTAEANVQLWEGGRRGANFLYNRLAKMVLAGL